MTRWETCCFLGWQDYNWSLGKLFGNYEFDEEFPTWKGEGCTIWETPQIPRTQQLWVGSAEGALLLQPVEVYEPSRDWQMCHPHTVMLQLLCWASLMLLWRLQGKDQHTQPMDQHKIHTYHKEIMKNKYQKVLCSVHLGFFWSWEQASFIYQHVMYQRQWEYRYLSILLAQTPWEEQPVSECSSKGRRHVMNQKHPNLLS